MVVMLLYIYQFESNVGSFYESVSHLSSFYFIKKEGHWSGTKGRRWGQKRINHQVNMFTAEGFSETGPFKRLKNHVFQIQ